MARGGRSRAVRDRLAKVVATDFPTRLAKAAQEARDAEEAWRLACERRDELVVEAVDIQGIPQTAIAEMIGVTKGRIHAILLASQSDDHEAEA
jgi:DNA-directed RNA polymerase specialized sigma24 family protein